MTPSFLIVNLSTHGSELRICSYVLQYDHIMKAQKNVNIFFGTFTVVRDQFIKCILKKSILSSKIMPMFCIWWWRTLVLSEHMYILGHLIFSPKLVPSGVFFYMYWCLQALNNKNGGNNQRSFWLRFRLQNETEIVNMSLSFRFILLLWYSGGHQGLLASCYQTIWVTNIHVTSLQ